MSEAIVITGGSRGIGKALVEQLSKKNERTIFYTYKNQNVNPQYRSNVFSYQADCATREGVVNFTKFILKNTKKITALINNVGLPKFELLANTSLDLYQKIITTNVYSAWYMYQQLYPLLKDSKGVVINVSSIVVNRPVKGSGAYAASKAALMNLSETMAREARNDGIKIMTITPGLILTEAMQEDRYLKMRHSICKKIALERLGSLEEIRNTIDFLLNNAKMLVGSNLYITGGYQ